MENPDSPNAQGEGGGAYIKPIQEMQLIRKALCMRRRFRITRGIKARMIEACERNLDSDDDRVVNAAIANLIKMESLNASDEHKFLDKQIPDATHEKPLPLADAIHEPQYLEYLEAAHMAADRHARVVGDLGQQREMEVSETPTPVEQGAD